MLTQWIVNSLITIGFIAMSLADLVIAMISSGMLVIALILVLMIIGR